MNGLYMNNVKMEFILLVRNRAILFLCSAYLLVALVALLFGCQRFYTEQKQIHELTATHAQDILDWKEKIKTKDAGSAAYYLFSPVAFSPSPWSALFSGERQDSSVLQRVRLLSVHGQIHNSPMTNSEHSALGILDMQFVWLYLLPLLIGLVTVNCIADDRRLGRWSLISVLTSVRNIVTLRLAVRFILVGLINILIMMLAFLLLPLKLDSTLLILSATLFIYQFFFFIISLIIVFLFLNARQSILTFVSIWILSVWLIPAIHFSSNLDSETYNIGVELLVKQRQDMNDSWDRDTQSDFEYFLKKYPQWRNTPLEGFDWKWYYAMQKLSDDKVAKLAEQYLQQKREVDTIWRWLSPTLVTQIFFEDIANSGAADYQNWLFSIMEWHNKTQEFWFPYFFLEKKFFPQHFDLLPEFEFRTSDNPLKPIVIYWGVVFMVCAALLTALFFRSKKYHD